MVETVILHFFPVLTESERAGGCAGTGRVRDFASSISDLSRSFGRWKFVIDCDIILSEPRVDPWLAQTSKQITRICFSQ